MAYLGCILSSDLINILFLAIAKQTLAVESIFPFNAPKVDIITAIEINIAPFDPKTNSAAVAATRGDWAIFSIGKKI